MDLTSMLSSLPPESLANLTIRTDGTDKDDDGSHSSVDGKTWLVIKQLQTKNETEFVKKNGLHWEKLGLCHLQGCNAESENRCANCPSIFYCSKDHQLEDWKVHKSQCKKVIWQESSASNPKKSTEESALPFTASAGRDLAKGTLLFEKMVLLSCPRYPGWDEIGFNRNHPQTSLTIGRPRPCIECFELIINLPHNNNPMLEMFMPNNECGSCGWPLHANCSDGPLHRDECKILTENKIKYSPDTLHLLNHLGYMRGYLLKETKPEVWNQIKQLFEKREDNTEAFGYIVADAYEFLVRECKMFDTDMEELADLIATFINKRVSCSAEFNRHKKFVTVLCQGGNPLTASITQDGKLAARRNTFGEAVTDCGQMRMKFYTDKFVRMGDKLVLGPGKGMYANARACRFISPN